MNRTADTSPKETLMSENVAAPISAPRGRTLDTPRSFVGASLLNETGASRRAGSAITCSGCDAVWTGSAAAHCSGCHRSFSGATLFDRHRSVAGERGRCTDPATLARPDGQPICELRDGMWRFPEMDEATKAVRFGGGR
jgi:hypothetical protein